MATGGISARDAVILGAARVPQGRLLGALAPFSAVKLGQLAARAALERSGVNAADIDEVIIGQVVPAGSGQAVPRQISIPIGIPDHVGGLHINKACGSSLKAAMLAAGLIRGGDGELYLAGGVESMTNAPFMDLQGRQGHKYGHYEMIDAIMWDGLYDHVKGMIMGEAAEFIAKQFDISRQAMDEFACHSHQKAHAATQAGRFKDEIVPVTLPGRKGQATVMDADEPIRPDTSLEGLAKLRPAFADDGRVTAGNAPGLNDGAAAVVIASRAYAEAHGHTPLARVVGYAQAAVDPQWIFAAPIKALPLALARAGWTMDDVDLVELNEAFAAQVLADLEGLRREGHALPLEKLNVNGGSIALGHPIGASGVRVLVTLLHALRQRGLKRGLAGLCLGGGEAVAMAVELDA